jgi:hypothetical protein
VSRLFAVSRRGVCALCAMLLLCLPIADPTALISPAVKLSQSGLLRTLAMFAAFASWITWLQFNNRRFSWRVERELRSSEVLNRGMVEGSMQSMMLHRRGAPVFAN